MSGHCTMRTSHILFKLLHHEFNNVCFRWRAVAILSMINYLTRTPPLRASVAIHITPTTVHKTQILFPEQHFENNLLRRTCCEINLCAGRPPKLPYVEQ